MKARKEDHACTFSKRLAIFGLRDHPKVALYCLHSLHSVLTTLHEYVITLIPEEVASFGLYGVGGLSVLSAYLPNARHNAHNHENAHVWLP